jgi:hypothetical protein
VSAAVSRRAAFREADLNRAVKVAEKHGWKVVIEGDRITLLPSTPGAALPSADQAEAEWDRALGLGS